VIGHGPVGVVLAHERGRNLCSWLPYAHHLARLGLTALAFDFKTYAADLVDSVVAAAGELRRRGAEGILLIGASMGGTAVLDAARRVPGGVLGVVSVSGPSSFGDANAARAVRVLRAPVLFIVAHDDSEHRYQPRDATVQRQYQAQRAQSPAPAAPGTAERPRTSGAPQQQAARPPSASPSHATQTTRDAQRQVARPPSSPQSHPTQTTRDAQQQAARPPSSPQGRPPQSTQRDAHQQAGRPPNAPQDRPPQNEQRPVQQAARAPGPPQGRPPGAEPRAASPQAANAAAQAPRAPQASPPRGEPSPQAQGGPPARGQSGEAHGNGRGQDNKPD
jgi:dienelactone hydrolase